MKNNEPDAEVRDSVIGLLDDMPERYRMPIWLHHCMGFGMTETAEALIQGEAEVRLALVAGWNALQRMLRSRQMMMSDVSLAEVLGGVRAERAPECLVKSLGAITGVAYVADEGGELSRYDRANYVAECPVRVDLVRGRCRIESGNAGRRSKSLRRSRLSMN